MTTWVSARLEEQVHFITKVMTILGRHRYAPAAPLLWKLSSARHDRVSNAAKSALLEIIDDALLKRIFATIPRQAVETLFAKAFTDVRAPLGGAEGKRRSRIARLSG